MLLCFLCDGSKIWSRVSNETIRSYFFGGKSVLFCLCYTENMKTPSHVKKALKNIQTMDMFSADGWKRVQKALRKVTRDSDNDVLAEGNTDFIIIWYEDNDIDYGDVTQKKEDEINDILLERFVDYLLDD